MHISVSLVKFEPVVCVLRLSVLKRANWACQQSGLLACPTAAFGCAWGLLGMVRTGVLCSTCRGLRGSWTGFVQWGAPCHLSAWSTYTNQTNAVKCVLLACASCSKAVRGQALFVAGVKKLTCYGLTCSCQQMLSQRASGSPRCWQRV